MSYSSDYFTTRESWRDWRIEARWLIDAAHVVEGTRVLEIGCGGGGLLRMIAQRRAWAVGVDTLDVALGLARDMSLRGTGFVTKPSPTSESGIASQRPLAMTFVRIREDNALPFRDASFDAIIAQHAIEHLPDVHAALREWKRLLTSNGRIMLATPNALYPDPAHFADADHAHVFSPDELRAAVQRAGFIVESSSTIFPFLSRIRPFRAFGVIMYSLFQRAPYFATRGRTILVSARKI
jgi:SAM-dependent methyltransferase